MKTDRSGRTFEEYRQLYWDGQKRIDELEERLKFNQENHDALVARWEPHIAELEADLAKAKLSNAGMHKTIKRVEEELEAFEESTHIGANWLIPRIRKALGEAK